MDRFSSDVINGARPFPESYAFSALGISSRLKWQKQQMEGLESSVAFRRQTLNPVELRARGSICV
jgi:hypothetical protein